MNPFSQRHIADKDRQDEPVTCESCDFACKTKMELNLHLVAMHGVLEDYKHAETVTPRNQENRKIYAICRFWLRGFCRNTDQNCRFSHINPSRCKFQMQCNFWPNSKF